MPGLLYADGLFLCDESEKDLRAIVGCFVEICRSRDLKVNVGKNKLMLLNREDELDFEVSVDGIQLEHVSEFKYLGFVLDKLGTDERECHKQVASWRRDAGAIRCRVNARGLKLECARVCH